MKPTFVIASNNPKKLREIGAILEKIGARAISLKEAGITSDPEETGKTFEENSLIKARSACDRANLPAIADDSGLCVEALSGEPGIYSARYCEGSDTDRLFFLLKNMEGKENRHAKFVSAVSCVFPNGEEITVRGECHGEILYAPAGEGGFGYDPIFFVKEYEQTFAQLPPEVKNQISHRAASLRALAAELEKREINYADK